MRRRESLLCATHLIITKVTKMDWQSTCQILYKTQQAKDKVNIKDVLHFCNVYGFRKYSKTLKNKQENKSSKNNSKYMYYCKCVSALNENATMLVDTVKVHKKCQLLHFLIVTVCTVMHCSLVHGRPQSGMINYSKATPTKLTQIISLQNDNQLFKITFNKNFVRCRWLQCHTIT